MLSYIQKLRKLSKQLNKMIVAIAGLKSSKDTVSNGS